MTTAYILSPHDPEDEEFMCSKCGKDLMVPTMEGNVPLIGFTLGAIPIFSGDEKRDEQTRLALQTQFGKFEIGHYMFCMECSLKAISMDNLPF